MIVSLKLVLILVMPASPMYLSAALNPTTLGVYRKLASLVMTSIPVFLATAMTDWKPPRSIPTANGKTSGLLFISLSEVPIQTI